MITVHTFLQDSPPQERGKDEDHDRVHLAEWELNTVGSGKEYSCPGINPRLLRRGAVRPSHVADTAEMRP